MKKYTPSIFLATAILLILSCTGWNNPEYTIVFFQQNTGSAASLRGICAAGEETAWASGSTGTVLKTTDGGNTWKKLSVPGADSLDFRDIEAFGADTAYIMSAGTPAKIYKTVNGGRTWEQQYANDNPALFFNSMDFWDSENGIAVSDPVDGRFYLVSTSDGGRHWTETDPCNELTARKGEAEFAASGTCLITIADSTVYFGSGGTTARLFISHDRGKSWSFSETPMLSGKNSAGIFSIHAITESELIITGGDYRVLDGTVKNACRSTDGGTTWNLYPDGDQPGGFRSCVQSVPRSGGNMLLATGPSGTDISTDRGKSWTLHDSTGFHTMDFDGTSGAGWAAGSDGRIARILNKKK